MPETAIRYLVGSANRRTALASLRAHGPLTRRDLEDRTSASRRTVTRTLNELQERQWVERVEDGYDVTALGVTILDALEAALHRIDLASQFAPLLSQLPGDAIGFDVEELADASLVSTTDGNPYAAMHRLHELRTGADLVRELRPSLCLEFVEQIADAADADPTPLDVEAVVESPIARSTESNPDFAAPFGTLTATDAVTLHVCDEDVPYLLALYDGTAVICALNEDGIPVALVETTNPAVRDWVMDTYRSHRRQSTLVDA
jgi:predicted transcriptional regulator